MAETPIFLPGTGVIARSWESPWPAPLLAPPWDFGPAP